MLRKSLFTIFFLQLACFEPSHAQENAGQAGEFLRAGVGTRAIAMGRAFTSISDDASALYWNPAGLLSLTKVGGTFLFTHTSLQEGASLNYLAGAIPLRLFFVNNRNTGPLVNFVCKLNLGLGVLWHSLGTFVFYNEDASRSFEALPNSVAQSAIYFSISYPLNALFRGLTATRPLRAFRGDLEMGLTTKFIRQDLLGTEGTATSLDLGFKYTHYSGNVNIGLTIRDFNRPTFSYGDNLFEDRIPAYGMLGVSLTPPFGKLHGLLLAFDYELIRSSKGPRDLMFGLEYDFSMINNDLPVKVRIGTNSKYETIAVGISFSPETIWGHDWMPSGELTYANDRSSLDIARVRYSISLDRNPFTARYWYLEAMKYYPTHECYAPRMNHDSEKIKENLRKAERAKNPGNRAYRYEASLREIDLDFLMAVQKLRASNDAEVHDRQAALKQIKEISQKYVGPTQKTLFQDFAKSDVDFDDYFNSFVYYLQSLIMSGKTRQAVSVCADSGRTWGKNLNVYKIKSGEIDRVRSSHINYLYALALYQNNSKFKAVQLINSELSTNPLALFLLAQLAFMDGDYKEVLVILKDINLSLTRFPDNIYLPLTNDCTFGDEILFLKGAARFKISDPINSKNYLADFANILRFFPNSDLARFFGSGHSLLSTIIKYHEAQDSEKLEQLISQVIEWHIRSFFNGMSKPDLYTHNYP